MDIEHAEFGADQLLYCAGVNRVWCMDLALQTRWSHNPSELPGAPNIALDRKSGRVVLWTRGKHSAILLSAADGSMIGTLGGREPDDAKIHTFDCEHFRHMTGDLDSTMLVAFGYRLLRYDAHGAGIPTWASHTGFLGLGKQKLQPLYQQYQGKRVPSGGDKLYYNGIGAHPTRIDDYSSMFFGHDGRLYLAEEGVTCFDREGGKVYKTHKLDDIRRDACGADAQGNVYFRRESSGGPRSITRISPDGKRVEEIASDRRQGGSVGKERGLAVAPDGTLFNYGSMSRVRIFSPDGKLSYQSEGSKQDDADEDAAIARRA